SRSSRQLRSPLFPYTTLFRSIIAVSPFINRHVRHVARSDVFRARANQLIVSVLFEDMCCPTAYAADRKDRRVEIERNSHYVVSRSEEHTSELQSRSDLVCRLL